MTKNNLLLLIIGLFLVSINALGVLAQDCTQPRLGCTVNPAGIPGVDCRGTKDASGQCIIDDPDNDCDACPSVVQPPRSDVEKIFGQIKPPDALKDFVGKDPSGAGGISKFLSNLIVLIYSIATIVLIFMLLWGAFDWMTSEGDKEKLSKAQQKIINAIIGIILFAIAFAVIQVLGRFTGFTFFVGQKP